MQGHGKSAFVVRRVLVIKSPYFAPFRASVLLTNVGLENELNHRAADPGEFLTDFTCVKRNPISGSL